ncbi:hypothetical protein CYK80_01765 [Clostridium perfringens]|uniref:Uncharacterized protein n=1 Tax=Clostridium perfringens TaxID=1502 RepID=A0AB37CAT3_CLOPF|nr:hypothetical protein CYK91_02910 [Clostridium perfringens]PZT49586.1 hypothetical protein CYK80_01765 [Clostridium perfringens]VTQ55144.1 Uncharacterised protein [Clostridium perfringens]DAP32264.1 MAG TPA: hypothetical protein [Caudoviricetes sp.]
MVVIIKLKKFCSFFGKNLGISTLLTSILSVILGITINSLGTKIYIPLNFFIIYFIVSLFIFWFLILLLINLYNQKIFSEDIEIISFNEINGNTLCILKPCDLNNNALITIFYLENNVEIYVATAKFTNSQSNGYIQTQLLDIVDNEDWLNSIKNNDSSFLKKLIIKPIVTDIILDKRSELNEKLRQ